MVISPTAREATLPASSVKDQTATLLLERAAVFEVYVGNADKPVYPMLDVAPEMANYSDVSRQHHRGQVAPRPVPKY